MATASRLDKNISKAGIKIDDINPVRVHPKIFESDLTDFGGVLSAIALGPHRMALLHMLKDVDGDPLEVMGQDTWRDLPDCNVQLPSGTAYPHAAIVSILNLFDRNPAALAGASTEKVWVIAMAANRKYVLLHPATRLTLPAVPLMNMVFFLLMARGAMGYPLSFREFYSTTVSDLMRLAWEIFCIRLAGAQEALSRVAWALYGVYQGMNWPEFIGSIGLFYLVMFVWVWSLYQLFHFTVDVLAFFETAFTKVSEWAWFLLTLGPIRRQIDRLRGVKFDVNIVEPKPPQRESPEIVYTVEDVLEVGTGAGLPGKPGSVLRIAVESDEGVLAIGYASVIKPPQASPNPAFVLVTARHVVEAVTECGGPVLLVGCNGVAVPFEFQDPYFATSIETYDLAVYEFPSEHMSRLGVKAYVLGLPPGAAGYASITKHVDGKAVATTAQYNLDDSEPHVMRHRIPTTQGQSGSPLIINGKVVAVHVGGQESKCLNRAIVPGPLLRMVFDAMVLESRGSEKARQAEADRLAEEFLRKRPEERDWYGRVASRPDRFNDEGSFDDDYFVPDQFEFDYEAGVPASKSASFETAQSSRPPARLLKRRLPSPPSKPSLPSKPSAGSNEIHEALEVPRPPFRGSKPPKVRTESSTPASLENSNNTRPPPASQSSAVSVVARKSRKQPERLEMGSSLAQEVQRLASSLQQASHKGGLTQAQLKSLQKRFTASQKALGQLSRK